MMFLQVLIAVAAVSTLAADQSNNGGNKDMALYEFIEKTVEVIEPLKTKANTAYWSLATTGEEKYQLESEKYSKELRKFFTSKEAFEELKKLSDSNDPNLARQKLLLTHSFEENQIPKDIIDKMVQNEVEIEGIYTKFRPKINGKEVTNNDIKDILGESLDEKERKAAWEASKTIGPEVEAKVKALVKLRNEAAQKAGFDNYYSMSLRIQEIDERELFDILNKLETLTTPIWKVYKSDLDKKLSAKFNLSIADLRPWHYEDPFFQEAPQGSVDIDAFYKGKDIVKISSDFYRNIGMPVEDILSRSDLYERANKNQHAFCINIDQKQDIRILCNIRDNEYWMGTQLHELGHAVYEKYIDQSLPFLLRSIPHISSTEAIAMLFGRFSKDEDFLRIYCGVDVTKAKEVGNGCKKQNAANLLVFARWVLVMCHFERQMYQNPNVDLNNLWWELVSKYQGISKPEGRYAPDWAAKLHLACCPVYYQNYILGEMTASQLLHTINQDLKSKGELFVTSSLVGEFLKEKMFILGARYDWMQTLEKATGEKLNPKYFAEDVSILLNH